MLRGAISQAKDASSSMAVEKWLAREIEPYGKLVQFNIDSRAKSLRVVFHLNGEHHNVEIDVGKYEVVSEGGRDFIVVQQATASREWLRAVANNFLIGRKLEIPQQYASLAKMVL
jgi:hypothetical protein